MTNLVDLGHLRDWIGREEVATDIITPALVERFRATLPLATPADTGGPAPRLIHFCLCQPAVPASDLGPDGHPVRGGFLPPVPLPRRMWAGSDISFDGDLAIGDQVERISRIADVAVKEGRSGTLCFVTVDHRITGRRGGRVRDRQTIVYRDSGTAPGIADAAPTGDTVVDVAADSITLFRYSALTFNGHRIHYDEPYAREVEGYPGLVVHGPLQATLLLALATRLHGGVAPSRFTFRSVSTLFAGHALRLHAGKPEGGVQRLWTARPQGPVAMDARAFW